jgi:hypothetical protein
MNKYYINENIEKYSIKMPKSIMKKNYMNLITKKRQYFKFLKNITIK